MPAGTRARATEIEMPGDARVLTTLERVDYTDAFLVENDRAQEKTGEEWARAMLEGAPADIRRKLRWGWTLLGARLGSTKNRNLVFGWKVQKKTPDHALLAMESRLGMKAEVLVMRREKSVMAATHLQIDNPLARAVWNRIESRHRKILPHLLARAAAPDRP